MNIYSFIFFYIYKPISKKFMQFFFKKQNLILCNKVCDDKILYYNL